MIQLQAGAAITSMADLALRLRATRKTSCQLLLDRGQMFSTDQSHFRKYLTTLGVAVMAGTLSLAGLFLRLQQDLLVSKSTLAGLPSNARDALVRRQDYLTIATWFLPWFVIAGSLGGLCLSIFGMVGWAQRQRVSDELEDIDLRKGRAEVRRMTDAEKADKIDREAEEASQSPSEQNSPPGQVAEGKGSVSPETGKTDPDKPRTEGSGEDRPSAKGEASAENAIFSSIRTEYSLIEQELAQKLRSVYASSDVATDLVVRTITKNRVEADAVVRPSGPNTIVFELKYTRSRNNAMNQIVSGLQNLARSTEALNATGVLVAIVNDAASQQEVDRWRAQAIELADTYKKVARIYVGRYADFKALSGAELLRQVGLN
jgi:hypothetical protein